MLAESNPRIHNLKSTSAMTGSLDIVRLPGIVPGTANTRSDRVSDAQAPKSPNLTQRILDKGIKSSGETG